MRGNAACEAEAQGWESELPALEDRLAELYAKVSSSISPSGRVIVANYPNVVSNPYEFCSQVNSGLARLMPFLSRQQCPGISAKEVRLLRRAARKLSGAIKRAAATAGVELVDVRPDFFGKGCEGTPEWINCLDVSVEALVADPESMISSSFHPNLAGSVGYRDVVAQAFKN